jgi:hypothetical protein
VALHDTGEALALADRGDVDGVAGDEHVGRQLLADLVPAHVLEAELDQADAGGDVLLGEVPGLGLRQLLGLLLPIGDLQRAVAVALARLDLDDSQRLDAHHGHGHDAIGVVPDLCHADFFADECLVRHDGSSFSVRFVHRAGLSGDVFSALTCRAVGT